MFTGLVESQGIVTRVERLSGGARLEVYAPEFGRDMSIGDSVAVDGACLTVVKFIRGAFLADVSEETFSRTTLAGFQQGSKVNLERALRLSDRMGGHLVTGHVDAIGRLEAKQPAGNSTIYRFAAPPEVLRYLVPKGSVAVDGISLTVAEMRDGHFAASVVPHTEQATTLGEKPNGGSVNLEADVLGKYVERFVSLHVGGEAESEDPRRGLGEMLREWTDGR